ncbi:Peptidase [Modestobacter italicus]|uniref:Peptidase n=1 Tax=Modestobacter italicus (strain DSM 44449 / CECT 9708 / BC 501) TaxID=2732864 RepID=I4ETW3_MODI5|nr:M23 family metallopeptidase [Modestobacter marinus]CCH86826.1 Peptidase [Modestobacter marinus]
MDPQHLARLDDDGSVRSIRTGTAGGSTTAVSPRAPEVPVQAPALDSWPLPVGGDGPALPDVWPLPSAEAPRLLAEDAVPARPAYSADAVAAALAAGYGPRHRKPSTRTRRPALYLAAAMIGAAGIAGTAVATDSSPAVAQADEPVSVAEELGMVQAEQPAASAQDATARLQQMVASRAEREDAEAAAARVQADADAAAVAAAAEAARPKAVLPVQGARLSSGFGYRWGTLHAGIDFAAPLGTPEYAVMDGVVVRAGAASGFGLAVYVQHENGDVTVYGHMQEILVAEGQVVRAGDPIALLGNEGQSTGPHLHVEVRLGGIDGQKVDPLPWLRERGVQV